MSTMTCRSSYVGRIRRAFLMKAHPDRFRSHPVNVREQQSKLVQALTERMAEMDFVEYIQPTYGSNRRNIHNYNMNNNSNRRNVMKYHLEHKDGKLQSHSICLNKSAEQLLMSLSRALRDSGISGIPSPPTQFENSYDDNYNDNSSNSFLSNMLWEASSYNYNNNGESDSSQNYYKRRNRQFDIHSNRGRHLQSFLHNESICSEEIILRNKQHRLDAIAVASLAREAYQFQAIDGVTNNTNKMMSSSSFTKTLKALLVCHDEHSQKFSVSSFYPLRLIFSHDENHHIHSQKLDVYGGTLSIHPAATPEQWLQQSLLAVTPNKLQTLANNQKRLKKNVELVQKHLQINIRKGHSCTSFEYHDLLHRLALHCQSTSSQLSPHPSGKNTVSSSKLVTVFIESSQLLLYYSRRRGVVDPNTGNIQVSAGMNLDAICHSINSLRDEAIRKSSEQEKLQNKCKELVQMCQYQLGIANIRYKTNKITKYQVIQCLSRLLLKQNLNDNNNKHDINGRDNTMTILAGKSIGITNSGQYCHLGDDGSIMIPWDWL